MANFGDSFLDMAEAMLGKYDRSTLGKIKSDFASGPKHDIAANTGDSIVSHNSDCQFNHQLDKLDKHQERKSVVIVTPPKRRRTTENYSAVEVVRELNRAISKDERLEALKNAFETFDHNDLDLHDTEIEIGADVALVKNLVFLEFRAGAQRESRKCNMEAITQEIESAVKCLECVYRASSDAVGKSFNRVGNDVLQILVTLIDKEIESRMKLDPSSFKDCSDAEPNDNLLNKKMESMTTESRISNDIMIRKAAKIIGHFARVGKATRPMATFPGFLRSMLKLCNIRPYSMIPFEARLSCLWTIANLACNVDNMAMMIETPNLIDSLIIMSNRQSQACNTIESIMEILRAKSIASRTILNLSWSLENKLHMSRNPALVEALCHLVIERQAPYKKSKTMQKILAQTRRHSLASLRNISAAPQGSKIALCNYNNGNLLDVLTDVILNETDQSLVNLSFSTIHNLASLETAEVIVDRAALVLALKNVLLEGDVNSREGEAHTIKCQCASATILILERAITPDKSSYENFRELLDTINPSNSADCTDESSTSLNATAV